MVRSEQRDRTRKKIPAATFGDVACSKRYSPTLAGCIC
uniref:Uncharacterized protein n=1 Tax=Setaria italica TaxID=4555 RepID=K4AN13_SETIT